MTMFLNFTLETFVESDLFLIKALLVTTMRDVSSLVQ